jgi:hypothetical protein
MSFAFCIIDFGRPLSTSQGSPSRVAVMNCARRLSASPSVRKDSECGRVPTCQRSWYGLRYGRFLMLQIRTV